MTKKLEILLLGPPIVRWNCELISIQRRLPRVLLFYLAWQGTMVPRETVLNLFWKEGDNVKIARTRLNETLSRLRRALPVDDIILSHNDLIGLNLEKVYIDRLHFENLIDEAGRIPWQIPENEPLPPEIYRLLVQANNLWRGNFAMQGLFFPTPELDNWLQQTSEHVQGLRINVLTCLSDHASTTRDLQAALDFAYTALEYDSLNQDIQYRVMQNLEKLGQVGKAQQYFDSVREIMLQELGVNPSPAMIKIYQKIRKLDDAPLPDIEPKWEIHPSMDIPFVGRENTFCTINKILAKHHGVVIVGESGQGKSRLVQEYTARINPRPRLLLAVCRPLESSLPFQPFVELFRRHVTPDEWLALSPIWATHLVSLLPELNQIRDDLNQISLFEDSDQAQAMIFESIRQVFILMNERRPLFLVIDDSQWADEATLSTIAFLLVRAPFTTSASLTLIARSEDISDSLQTMVDAIQQSKHASIVTLNNLRREAIEELTNYLLKDQPSEQFISNLITDTGGNTFFVLEILRAIIEANMDVQELDINLPLTENLQNLILTRIQTISSPARETIEVAALIGSKFSLKVLEKVCLRSNNELSPILDELERKLLIMPSNQQNGEQFYHFAHDKIRETLLRRIPPARAQVLHARIVQAMTQTHYQAAVLAHHYSGAGELITAFRYWIKAAERARLLFAKQDASRNYAQAEAVLQEIASEISGQEIYHFYADWNDLAYNASETRSLKHIGHELIRHGEERKHHLLIGSGLDALSDACMTVNDFELGLDYTNQAIAHLEQGDNSFELVEAYNHRGTFLYMLNRLEEALISFQDALALSTEIKDSKINKALSNAHYQTALLQVLFGKPVQGLDHGIKALEYAEQIRHTYSIVQAYGIQSLAQCYMGEFVQARETALKGIKLAERMQGWRMLGYLNSYAAIAEVALGYIDAAYDHALAAVEIGQKYEQYDISALGYRSLGEIHRLLYDYSQAVKYHQNGYAGLPENFMGFDNLYRLGLAQHYQDNPEGIEQIMLSRATLEDYAVDIGVLTANICIALVYAAAQDWQKAKELATEIEQVTMERGIASYHINAICILAETAFAEGNYESALERARFAAGEAQFIHNPWLEIKAQAIIERAQQLLGLNATRAQERIKSLLEQLEEQSKHPEIRTAYKNFRDQIIKRTWIATDTI